VIRDGFPTQSVAWLYVKRHLIVPSRPEIKDRIGYLTRQDEELIAEKAPTDRGNAVGHPRG
jgi:hypothetical protein